MKLLFLDTETTGLSATDRLCEIAYAIREPELDSITVVSKYFKPPVPVSLDAMCINHITNEFLAGRPTLLHDPEFHTNLNKLLRTHVLIAHNASFDIGMLEKERGTKVKDYICTKKVAKHLDLADKNTLQYLRYSLGLTPFGSADQPAGPMAHSAAGDVMILMALFNYMEEKISVEEMIKISMT